MPRLTPVRVRPAVLMAFAVFASTAASARPADDLAELRTELAALRSEVAALRARSRPTWLDDARAAEVRAIVDEVVADARRRSGFQDAGRFAGHDGRAFTLAGDGFQMNLSGHLQFRHVQNWNGGRAGEEEHLHGFELRRAKVQLDGHLADPKITYLIRLVSSRGDGGASLEEATLGYTFDNGVKLVAGKMKLPFLKQELISSKKQLAVDRGLTTEFFTLDFAEQVQVQASVGDGVRLALAYSDGGNSESSGATTTTVAYALTGRADVKLAGDWSRGGDLVAFDDDPGVFLGVAAHQEKADVAGETTLAWTADALLKRGAWSALLAYMGARGDLDDRTLTGLLGEAGYSVTRKLQPFARYEWLDDDTPANPLQAATAGVNYYLKGQNAKLTTDLIWVFDGGTPASLPGLNGGAFGSGLGLSGGDAANRDQVVWRVQMQLLF